MEAAERTGELHSHGLAFPTAMALGALGIVYGDIGTSPLYALNAYSDEAGRGFRFEAGRHSEAKPATVPI